MYHESLYIYHKWIRNSTQTYRLGRKAKVNLSCRNAITQYCQHNITLSFAGSSSTSCGNLRSSENEESQGRVRQSPSTRPPQSVIMRLIDDFLIITPSCTAAQALAACLKAGKFLLLLSPRHGGSCAFVVWEAMYMVRDINSARQVTATLERTFLPGLGEEGIVMQAHIISRIHTTIYAFEVPDIFIGADLDKCRLSASVTSLEYSAGWSCDWADADAEHPDSVTGFPDYGISINPAKTRANFDGMSRWPSIRCTYKTADGAEFIKWCGLQINVSSLEVQADYTRYSGQHLASSLSLTLHKVCQTLHNIWC